MNSLQLSELFSTTLLKVDVVMVFFVSLVLCTHPLQSETCSILIPELEFELGMAAVGGKFTTLEGLLKDIKHLVGISLPLALKTSMGTIANICLF